MSARRAAVVVTALLASAAAVASMWDMPEQIPPDEFTLRVVWEPSRMAILAAAKELGHDALAVDGFAVLKRGSQTGRYVCEMHLTKPKTLTPKEQERLGHELAHCLFGEYHK